MDTETTPSHRIALRTGAWAVALVSLLGYVAITVAPLPSVVRDNVLSIWYLIPVAAALLAVGATLPVTRGAERRAWHAMFLGVTLFAISELYWAITDIATSERAIPGGTVAHWIGLAGYLGVAAAIIGFDTGSHISLARRLGQGVDLMLITLFACLLLVVAVIDPLTGGAVFMNGVDAVDFLMIAGDIALILMIFALGYVRTFTWAAEIVMFLGSWFVADLSFFILTKRGLYDQTFSGAVVDLLWMLGFLLLMHAALRRRYGRHLPTMAAADYGVRGPRDWPVIFGLTSAILGAPLALFELTHKGLDPSATAYFASTCAALTTLVAARVLLYVIENHALATTSTTDPLTGIYNFRFFQQQLEREMGSAARHDSPLSLVTLDVDDFDQINNLFGHQAGDGRLRAIARCAENAARSVDTVCRLGGDEFAALLPGTTAEGALHFVDRLRHALAVPDGVCDVSSTISVGIAQFPLHADNVCDLVRRADQALYSAKYSGRNRVVTFSDALLTQDDEDLRIAAVESESYLKLVRMFAAAVDARDAYTQSHSAVVADMVQSFGAYLGLDAHHTGILRTAALLHDVGKIGITDSVLRKPGALDEVERIEVNRHPDLATRILAAVPRSEILPWIRAHHERWDGAGYPDGLSGESIPYEARIICICDAFDAMTADRAYRPSKTTAEALAEITACAGTQFDADLAHAFVAMMHAQEARDVANR